MSQKARIVVHVGGEPAWLQVKALTLSPDEERELLAKIQEILDRK